MKPLNETEIVGIMSRHDREVLGRGYDMGMKEMKYRIDKIKAEIEQTVNEEASLDERWSRGLHYALKIIDKHINGGNNK